MLEGFGPGGWRFIQYDSAPASKRSCSASRLISRRKKAIGVKKPYNSSAMKNLYAKAATSRRPRLGRRLSCPLAELLLEADDIEVRWK